MSSVYVASPVTCSSQNISLEGIDVIRPLVALVLSGRLQRCRHALQAAKGLTADNFPIKPPSTKLTLMTFSVHACEYAVCNP